MLETNTPQTTHTTHTTPTPFFKELYWQKYKQPRLNETEIESSLRRRLASKFLDAERG